VHRSVVAAEHVQEMIRSAISESECLALKGNSLGGQYSIFTHLPGFDHGLGSARQLVDFRFWHNAKCQVVLSNVRQRKGAFSWRATKALCENTLSFTFLATGDVWWTYFEMFSFARNGMESDNSPRDGR
jgi:hypothetical protein